MNNKILIIFLLVLLVVSYMLGQWLRSGNQPEGVYQHMQYRPCDPGVDVCKAFIYDHELTFRFMQPASPMTPFTVVLRSKSFEPESISVEFTMPGMDMGENRYRLQAVEPGLWQAQVVLPVCSMGRSDWVGHLYLKGKEHNWKADFPFRVGKE